MGGPSFHRKRGWHVLTTWFRRIKYLVKIGTPVEHGYDVKTLCIHGPFEFFKHPMYCAMMGCSLATVFTNDSLCEFPFVRMYPPLSPLLFHPMHMHGLHYRSDKGSRDPKCEDPIFLTCPSGRRVVGAHRGARGLPLGCRDPSGGEVHGGQVWHCLPEQAVWVRNTSKWHATLQHDSNVLCIFQPSSPAQTARQRIAQMPQEVWLLGVFIVDKSQLG